MATVVGIDVSKSSLDMAVHGIDLVVRYSNTSGGISKLINRLKVLKASRVVVEATGGYEDRLLDACSTARLWIARVNPRQARNFARATGQLAKTDAIDARLLALMAHLLGDRLRRYAGVSPCRASSGIGCVGGPKLLRCCSGIDSRRNYRLVLSAH